MLYSICSMQFWINKSNLVCAENDLSTHLCIDCISLRPKRLTTPKDWQAGSSAHTRSCCCPSLRPVCAFCTSPLPAQHTFVWAAVVTNAFDFKYEFKFDFIYIRFGKRQIACEWSHVVLPVWPWLGDGRLGLVVPYLKLKIPTQDWCNLKVSQESSGSPDCQNACAVLRVYLPYRICPISAIIYS